MECDLAVNTYFPDSLITIRGPITGSHYPVCYRIDRKRGQIPRKLRLGKRSYRFRFRFFIHSVVQTCA
ncbi:hypothetical protein QE152_g4336 [Popillia japonica]|uniref:Uncharacterized protein n=1 Tax=Popillia japonica TaxID=7064 RepID=A0AAW1N322_POPJA